MTLPDDLVKAVVEAIPLTLDTRYRLLEQERRQVAELAVAAMLRALPESDEVIYRLYRGIPNVTYDEAKARIAAITRLADDA